MRISDWSSDVCSSDLPWQGAVVEQAAGAFLPEHRRLGQVAAVGMAAIGLHAGGEGRDTACARCCSTGAARARQRSGEHTSELQSLMRISYAVFCLKKKKQHTDTTKTTTQYI